MARYLLVQVDDNDRAEKLRQKLDPVAGIRVVGMFARPTKFCDCKTESAIGINARSVQGAKYGWRLHEECRRPKRLFHQLKNLLDPEDLNMAIQYRDLFLNIREPYAPPLEKYGADLINAQVERSEETWARLARANDPKVQARRAAARERRRAKKARKNARTL